jgi:Uma2 family endonuclease
MSIADKYRPQFKYEDYLVWEGRWELIDGMPYAMSPSPAADHQKINGRLWSIFENALQINCDKCEAFLPIDWKINENTVVQPDLVVVCSKLKKKYLDFTPSVTVEILSPSTALKDRHEKFELYEQEGVQYYLIVDPQFKKIEIYQLKKGKYQLINIHPANAEFTLKDGCRFSINLESIWNPIRK